jgi:hypothetical protein
MLARLMVVGEAGIAQSTDGSYTDMESQSRDVGAHWLRSWPGPAAALLMTLAPVTLPSLVMAQKVFSAGLLDVGLGF